MTGEQLCHNKYKQPIFGDQGVEGEFIYADYVTLDDGTGIVHAAPGHGVDDYNAGSKFGIPVVMPVDDDGRFYVGDEMGTGGPWSGMEVNEANPKIIEWLGERGMLILHEDINHSYPHCWRCHQPVLFRATDQWFISMDKTGLRAEALDTIENKVAWYPEHAKNRIGAMVEGRPDWCISRQRNWGVPIPSFTCEDCGETVVNDATLDAVIKLFHEKGSDAWFTDKPEDYLARRASAPSAEDTTSRPARTSSTSGGTPASPGRPSASSVTSSSTPPTCTSRAPTSTAAGSRARCSPRLAPTTSRRTRPSSPRASRLTARAAR